MALPLFDNTPSQTLQPMTQPTVTPASLAARRNIALAMLKEGADYSPIRSPWQGVARVADAIMGGYQAHRLDQQELAGRQAASSGLANAIAGAFGGGTSSGTFPPAPGSTPSDATINATPSAAANSPTPSPVSQTASNGGDEEAYIRQAAASRGIDPDIAVKVASGEGGLSNPYRHGEGPAPRSQAAGLGSTENSYGPFQLYVSGTGAGLGDRALAAGIDPRKNWQAGVDFALDEAKNKGWGQWYGAKAQGITGMMGIGQAPAGSPAAAAANAVANGQLPQTAPIPQPNPVQVASLDPSAGMASATGPSATVPPEFASKGITQAQWDAMNAPDSAAAAPASMAQAYAPTPSPDGVQPPMPNDGRVFMHPPMPSVPPVTPVSAVPSVEDSALAGVNPNASAMTAPNGLGGDLYTPPPMPAPYDSMRQAIPAPTQADAGAAISRLISGQPQQFPPEFGPQDIAAMKALPRPADAVPFNGPPELSAPAAAGGVLPPMAAAPSGAAGVAAAMNSPSAPAPAPVPPAPVRGANVAAAMNGGPSNLPVTAGGSADAISPMGVIGGNGRMGMDPSQISAISSAMANPWMSDGQQQLLGSVLSSRLTPHKIEMVPLGNGVTAEIDSITGQQVGQIKGSPSYTSMKDAAGNEYLVNTADPTHPITVDSILNGGQGGVQAGAQQAGGSQPTGGQPTGSQPTGTQPTQTGQADPYASPFPRTMARTDVMKDYEGYLAQSKSLNQPPMSFNDYQLDLKKQGAQSIVFANENEAQKKVGEAIGGNMADYIDGAKDARSKLQALNVIKGVLDQYGDNISTGPGAATMLSLKQGLANVFPGMADAATPTEMLQKMSTQLATADAKSLASRPTQFDFATYLKNNPGIQMSVAGQKALVDLKLQQAQHDYELGSMATHKQYSAHPDEWADVVAQYDKDHPLINPLTNKPADANAVDFPAPKPGTQTAAPAQPPAGAPTGAKQAPDGNWYVPDPARPGKYLKVVQ